MLTPLHSPVSPTSITSTLPSPRSFNPVRIFHKVSRQNSFCGFRSNNSSTENLTHLIDSTNDIKHSQD